ncbi:MAG: type II toxin-antitoxin system VapC family toxin [Gammaproteobacteria bacterium]|nr:MAG: type II toxin-antitoxin system VapC family toxin [Gammaproteobacteria bacterium]
MGTTGAARERPLVLIDTCIWIYHFSGDARFGNKVSRLLRRIERGEWEGIVSEISLLEILVQPLRLGRQEVADTYELVLERFPHLEICGIGREETLSAAALRARYGLRTPDALILATGLNRGATLALTQDHQWRRIREIEVRTLDE